MCKAHEKRLHKLIFVYHSPNKQIKPTDEM